MTESANNVLLSLQTVRAGYGALEVLHGVSMEVRQGEIVTLIGANGAGKSTTLKTVSGIVKATAGDIVLEHESIRGALTNEIVGRGIVQVPEGRRLFPDMTVQENLEMGAFLRRDKPAIAGDLERVFTLFPVLKERRKQQAGCLSGGEQQMCAIARGLMARPRLMLLDEPSLGLAPLLVEHIFRIIREINEQGVTIFLVEQNAHMALSLAHRGYVMATGHIELTGTGQDLLHNDQVRKTYLGEL